MYDYENDREIPFTYHVIVVPDPTKPKMVVPFKLYARSWKSFLKKLDERLHEYEKSYTTPETDEEGYVPF